MVRVAREVGKPVVVVTVVSVLLFPGLWWMGD